MILTEREKMLVHAVFAYAVANVDEMNAAFAAQDDSGSVIPNKITVKLRNEPIQTNLLEEQELLDLAVNLMEGTTNG